MSNSSIRIGTSGYTYSWNERRPSPFMWYVTQGFNSVEINASYYRFPMESWVNTWRASAPQDFKFSIKVNRSITDYLRLKGDRALDLWNRFSETLEGIDDKIDFWLFKMPRTFRYTEHNLETVRVFFERSGLTKNNNTRAVIEFRDPSWWEVIDRIEDVGLVFCSIDAPGLPRTINATNKSIYLRIHGYKEWYRYIYSQTELDEILTSVINLNAEKKAIYLNNDHGMLQNGLYLLKRTHNTPSFRKLVVL
jgi:uncharacterized protein YecE (DUF72 family)